MKRKVPLLLTIWLLFCLGLTGCARAEKPPKEVQERYTQYMEAMRVSTQEAAPYCYFISESERELFLGGSSNAAGYEVLSWTRLSDRLWVVEFQYWYDSQESARHAYNFVGNIDGDYYVIQAVRMLPDELKEGLDLTPYCPEDAILPEDIIGVIEPG